MSDRDEFEKQFPIPNGVIRCGDSYTPTEFYADQSYGPMWEVWKAARAQSGQGAEPQVIGRVYRGVYGKEGEAVPVLNSIGMPLADGAPLYSNPQPAQQGSVPEGWRECLAEMVQAMHDYEMSVDEGAPYKHRAMMDRAHVLLSATPQPGSVPESVPSRDDLVQCLLATRGQSEGVAADAILWLFSATTSQPEGDGWVKCSERFPTEADGDFQGGVFFCDRGWIQAEYWHVEEIKTVAEENPDLVANAAWKPTGLKRPQPPAGQEGEGNE